MIAFWQRVDGKIEKITDTSKLKPKEYTWIDARNVNKEDIRVLQEEYGVLEEHILDILDPDELSRVEKEDDYTVVIARFPIYLPSDGVSYFTTPIGMILRAKQIITICWTDCEVLQALVSTRIKQVPITDLPSFIIRMLSLADLTFLRYLKEINRRSTLIQDELSRSIKNDELIKLLNLEKSLVFFTTSLKSNQLLLEKLQKTRWINFDTEDREYLGDVEIDNRQAIEMADTYSDIMSGMMDAFASVISNNLNIVMKKLTVISLILMMPTFIVSFFGMNVPLPFAERGWLGVCIIAVLCASTSIIAYLVINITENPAPKAAKIKKVREIDENRKKTKRIGKIGRIGRIGKIKMGD
ncbi:MAG: magnesium transporter CorA family protein [Treponemataceae bacterium]|nr:MAG: magnesium transporter CorA family protein [Treponemataceae bacterium]